MYVSTFHKASSVVIKIFYGNYHDLEKHDTKSCKALDREARNKLIKNVNTIQYFGVKEYFTKNYTVSMSTHIPLVLV